MSTEPPGKHIDGMLRAFAHKTEGDVPAGWTREAWEVYKTDADGGRAPYRTPEEDSPSERWWGGDE